MKITIRKDSDNTDIWNARVCEVNRRAERNFASPPFSVARHKSYKKEANKSVKHQSPLRPATCHITNISLIKIEMPKSTSRGKKAKRAATAQQAATAKSHRQGQAAKATPPKSAAAEAPSDSLRSSKRKAKAVTRLIATEQGPQHGSTPASKKKKKKKAKGDDARAQEASENDDESTVASKSSEQQLKEQLMPMGEAPSVSGGSVEDIMRNLDQDETEEDDGQHREPSASPSTAEASSPAHLSQKKKVKSDEPSDEEDEEPDPEPQKKLVLEMDEEHRNKEWISLKDESICEYFEARQLSKTVGQALTGCGLFGHRIMRVLEGMVLDANMNIATISALIDKSMDLKPVSGEIITDAIEALEATVETHAANLSLATKEAEEQAESETGATAQAAQDSPAEQEAAEAVSDDIDASDSDQDDDDDLDALASDQSDEDDDEEDGPLSMPLKKKKRNQVRVPLSRTRHSDNQIDLCRDNSDCHCLKEINPRSVDRWSDHPHLPSRADLHTKVAKHTQAFVQTKRGRALTGKNRTQLFTKFVLPNAIRYKLCQTNSKLTRRRVHAVRRPPQRQTPMNSRVRSQQTPLNSHVRSQQPTGA